MTSSPWREVLPYYYSVCDVLCMQVSRSSQALSQAWRWQVKVSGEEVAELLDIGQHGEGEVNG